MKRCIPPKPCNRKNNLSLKPEPKALVIVGLELSLSLYDVRMHWVATLRGPRPNLQQIFKILKYPIPWASALLFICSDLFMFDIWCFSFTISDWFMPSWSSVGLLGLTLRNKKNCNCSIPKLKRVAPILNKVYLYFSLVLVRVRSGDLFVLYPIRDMT